MSSGEANILAIDPGSKSCAYAAVRSVGPRVQFGTAGAFEVDPSRFLYVLDVLERDWGLRPTVLGLERPSGFIHDPFRGPTVLATSYAAGGIAWLARSRGLHTVEVSAEQGRKIVLGTARPKKFRAKKGELDRMVKEALPSFVLDLPRATNVHVRDALLVAVATNWLRQRKG